MRSSKRFGRGLILRAAIVALVVIACSLFAYGHWIVGATAAAIALAASACRYAIVCSLPRWAGRIDVRGACATVRIVRDHNGVPHIKASSRRDAWFGLGFVHAQDRIWQMEVQRRLGQGRISELIGKSGVHLDRMMRTIGIARVAAAAWESLSGETQELIESYAAGINAFLQATPRRRMSPECVIFRMTPSLWSAQDVLTVSKLIAWNLSSGHALKMLRSELNAALGAQEAWRLMGHPQESAPPVNSGQSAPLSMAAFGEEPLGAEARGSNLWVVDGEKSASGKPCLANDPHLPASLPLLWYVAHVSGGDLDAIGSTIPGMPGVLMGRNQRIAWGITNLNADVQDLHPVESDAQVLGQRSETIRVKQHPDVEVVLRWTSNGPVISDALGSGHFAKDTDTPGPGVALSWTGLTEGDTTLEGVLGISVAGSWSDFTSALRLMVAPTLTFGYADIEGNIGAHAAGRIPVPKTSDHDNSCAFDQGHIPFDSLPSEYNPARHYVVSTNNHTTPLDYEPILSREWVEPHRHLRICTLISSNTSLAVQDHQRIQADTFSSHARHSLPLWLSLVAPLAPDGCAEAIALLERWDFDMKGASSAAAVFSAWWVALAKAVVGDRLSDRHYRAYSPWSSYIVRYVNQVMAGQIEHGNAPSDLAEKSLKKALIGLQQKLGPDIRKWRWDQLHKAVLPHFPFHHHKLLRRWFSRHIGVGGDWSSINFGAYSAGHPYIQRNLPGYRQIIDLGNPSSCLYIYAGGQSGHFLSPQYDSYLNEWASVKYRIMDLDWNSLDSKQLLVLLPHSKS